MPSHSEGPGIWFSVWRFLLTYCLYERMRRLAWTFAARIGDKYQIRLTRPIKYYSGAICIVPAYFSEEFLSAYFQIFYWIVEPRTFLTPFACHTVEIHLIGKETFVQQRYKFSCRPTVSHDICIVQYNSVYMVGGWQCLSREVPYDDVRCSKRRWSDVSESNKLCLLEQI